VASDSGVIERLIGRPMSELAVKGTEFDPKRAGIIGGFISLVVAGIGSVIVTFGVGLAAIPAGLVIALEGLLNALRTFLVEFVSSFFLPFEVATACAFTAGAVCSSASLPGVSGGLLVQSAGILGLVMATVLTGALMYIGSTVVSGG
jgi:hypothetical protein